MIHLNEQCSLLFIQLLFLAEQKNGGIGQDHVHHHLYDVMQNCSTAFLQSILHEKILNGFLQVTILYYVIACTKQLCM